MDLYENVFTEPENTNISIKYTFKFNSKFLISYGYMILQSYT